MDPPLRTSDRISDCRRTADESRQDIVSRPIWCKSQEMKGEMLFEEYTSTYLMLQSSEYYHENKSMAQFLKQQHLLRCPPSSMLLNLQCFSPSTRGINNPKQLCEPWKIHPCSLENIDMSRPRCICNNDDHLHASEHPIMQH